MSRTSLPEVEGSRTSSRTGWCPRVSHKQFPSYSESVLIRVQDLTRTTEIRRRVAILCIREAGQREKVGATVILKSFIDFFYQGEIFFDENENFVIFSGTPVSEHLKTYWCSTCETYTFLHLPDDGSSKRIVKLFSLTVYVSFSFFQLVYVRKPK